MKSIIKSVLGVSAVLGTYMPGIAIAGDVENHDTSESCLYIRGDVGLAASDAYKQPETEIGIAVAGGFGCQFTDMFRADITFDGAFGYEFDFRGKSADAKSYSIMANGYIDLANGSILTPYIGAGLGYGGSEVSGDSIQDSGTGFAWAAMGGIGVTLSENLILDVGYKYRRMEGSGYWGDHLIRGGLRIGF